MVYVSGSKKQLGKQFPEANLRHRLQKVCLSSDPPQQNAKKVSWLHVRQDMVSKFCQFLQVCWFAYFCAATQIRENSTLHWLMH
jgi:hypothetical protein